VCVCVFWQNDEVVVEDVKEDEDVDDDDGDDEDEEDGAQGCFFSSSSVCVFTTLLFDGVLFGWFEGFICAALSFFLLDLIDLWGLLYWVVFEFLFEVAFEHCLRFLLKIL
jgi:hypothetical protein